LNHFGQVHAAAAGALANLLAAAEAIGNDERIRRCRAYGRQKFELANRD
jgi:hypothetical protein